MAELERLLAALQERGWNDDDEEWLEEASREDRERLARKLMRIALFLYDE